MSSPTITTMFGRLCSSAALVGAAPHERISPMQANVPIRCKTARGTATPIVFNLRFHFPTGFYVSMNHYERHNNARIPWLEIAAHRPPFAAISENGYVGARIEYLDTVTRSIECIPSFSTSLGPSN